MVKIKYINKRIVSGVLGLTLITTSLGGCSNNFEYKTDDNGNTYAIGNISHSNLMGCYLIELYNKSTNEEEVYIVNKKEKDNGYDYINLENNNVIYSTNSNDNEYDYICEIDIYYYLISLNEVRPNYTKEDFDRIINEIRTTYFSNENVKVRERTNSLDN